jgi:hypothetical protein
VLLAADERGDDGEEEERVHEADDAEKGKRHVRAVAHPLETVARSIEDERHEQHHLRDDADQPPPPGHEPERPVLGTTDQADGQLQRHDGHDGGRRFEAGFEGFLPRGVGRRAWVRRDGSHGSTEVSMCGVMASIWSVFNLP